MSKRERREGVVRPGGTYSFYVPGVPSELRIKDFNTEATVHTETEGVNPVRPFYSGAWRIGETWERWVGIEVRHAQAVTSALSGLWTYRSFQNPTAVSRTGPQKAQPAAHELILLEADFNLQTGIDPTTLQGAIDWEGGGLDLIHWHRQKAGTIEHAHDVLMNELAGAALPSQKFGANAAWLRLNVILYNLLSAYKRVGLPEEFHTARPKRLRFLLLNTVGKVVRHARETLLRCTKQLARALAGPPRTHFALKRPPLAGV